MGGVHEPPVIFKYRTSGNEVPACVVSSNRTRMWFTSFISSSGLLAHVPYF